MTKTEWSRVRTGLWFVSPWLAGFLIFNLYPLVSSLYLSLCDFSVLSKPIYIGTQNYRDVFTDELFWKALSNTLFFTVFSVPLNLVLSVSLALLLNVRLPGQSLFRTIYFLPSLVPAVCLGVIWQWLLNGELGLINGFLRPIFHAFNWLFSAHYHPPNWLQDPLYAKYGLLLISLWGVGPSVVIYLAALQEVPRELNETADLDGVGFFSRFWNITMPLISPALYFNGIISLIGALQMFTLPFVLTNGGDGPDRSLLFLGTYIYQNGFEYWRMGYACAIGFALFLLILLLTYFARKMAERRVFYLGS